MAMVKQLDKRSGITYVYEYVSYWDKEEKQLHVPSLMGLPISS